MQEEIKSGRLKSIKDMMLTSHAEWNGRLAIENYDQAWSMVHFLAQGEAAGIRSLSSIFMKLIGKGTPWENAWRQTFGDAVGFERMEGLLAFPCRPIRPPICMCKPTTASSPAFCTSCNSKGIVWRASTSFSPPPKRGKMKTGQTIEDWLPPKLLHDIAEEADKAPAKWTIEPGPGKTANGCRIEDGTRMVGSYNISERPSLDVMVSKSTTPAAP